MRALSTTWSWLAASLVGFGAFGALVLSHADESTTAFKASYRRPAETSGSPDLAADPVWTLGQTLFFDPNLGASRNLSCASCHKPDAAWSDHLPKGQGEGAIPLRFRTPTLLNVAYQERFGWEGQASSIADIAFIAMNSALNMNMSDQQILQRIAETQTYVASFKTTFADGAISKRNVGIALTRYVGSIISADTPFDRWIDGDANAIGASAARGFVLFNDKAGCVTCHKGWSLSDGSFHDVGIGKGSDIGRGARFKSSIKLQYAFKTPTLRGVAERAPYMHDGSLPTLAAVVDHYDRGGIERPSRDTAVHPLHLSVSEKADLVAFLQTLSGPTRFVVPSALQTQD